jgi:hypothetical protein
MTPRNRTLREGLVVGLIGYASVAIFYSAFDLLAGRGTLYTVDLLGKAVFRGLRDPSVLLFPIPIDAAAVFWYNAMHFVIALAIGLLVTFLVGHAEARPARAYQVLALLVGGFAVTVAAVGMLTTSVRSVLPWWSIVVANALATAAAGSYLLQRRPGLLRKLLPFLR